MVPIAAPVACGPVHVIAGRNAQGSIAPPTAGVHTAPEAGRQIGGVPSSDIMLGMHTHTLSTGSHICADGAPPAVVPGAVQVSAIAGVTPEADAGVHGLPMDGIHLVTVTPPLVTDIGWYPGMHWHVPDI